MLMAGGRGYGSQCKGYELRPFEILFPSPDLEVVLDNSEVHLAVTYHGEQRLGRDLGKFAIISEAQILQIELLLVDGRRR